MKIESLSEYFICVHLCSSVVKILKLTGLGVPPGREMREAGRLRTGLERDAPATILTEHFHKSSCVAV